MYSLLSHLLGFACAVAGAALRRRGARQSLWLAASYAFYATFGARFLAVLVVSSVFNFIYGAFLRRNPTSWRLAGGIAANVSLLVFYKVTPVLAGIAGSNAGEPEFLRGIAMPIGMSFWTFQAMSYLFDLYRQEDLDPSFVEFCLYMAFWPTVIMGPICRLDAMLPQFRGGERLSSSNLLAGAKRIVMGLFMKVVLSQLLASGLTPGSGVAAGFAGDATLLTGVDVWSLAIGFGFQLFFDFAGYSHIAIGTARLFGVRVAENFDAPFTASTPAEFWSRWHMSLSSWIRDYVFVPLASARRELAWRYCALALSMTLFGLWHGANLTFLLWGLYHGMLLIAHRAIQQARRQVTWRPSAWLDGVMSWVVTFLAMSLGWILFRSADLAQAVTMLRAIVTPSHYFSHSLGLNYYLMLLTVVAGYFAYYAVCLPIYRRIAAGLAPEVRPRLAEWGITPEFTTVLWFIPMAALLFLGILIVNSSGEGITPFVYAVF